MRRRQAHRDTGCNQTIVECNSRGYAHLLLSAHGIAYTTCHRLLSHTTHGNKWHPHTHGHKFRQAEHSARSSSKSFCPWFYWRLMHQGTGQCRSQGGLHRFSYLIRRVLTASVVLGSVWCLGASGRGTPHGIPKRERIHHISTLHSAGRCTASPRARFVWGVVCTLSLARPRVGARHEAVEGEWSCYQQ